MLAQKNEFEPATAPQRQKPFGWHYARYSGDRLVRTQTLRAPMEDAILANLQHHYTVVVTELFAGAAPAALISAITEWHKRLGDVLAAGMIPMPAQIHAQALPQIIETLHEEMGAALVKNGGAA